MCDVSDMAEPCNTFDELKEELIDYFRLDEL